MRMLKAHRGMDEGADPVISTKGSISIIVWTQKKSHYFNYWGGGSLTLLLVIIN